MKPDGTKTPVLHILPKLGDPTEGSPAAILSSLLPVPGGCTRHTQTHSTNNSYLLSPRAPAVDGWREEDGLGVGSDALFFVHASHSAIYSAQGSIKTAGFTPHPPTPLIRSERPADAIFLVQNEDNIWLMHSIAFALEGKVSVPVRTMLNSVSYYLLLCSSSGAVRDGPRGAATGSAAVKPRPGRLVTHTFLNVSN